MDFGCKNQGLGQATANTIDNCNHGSSSTACFGTLQQKCQSQIQSQCTALTSQKQNLISVDYLPMLGGAFNQDSDFLNWMSTWLINGLTIYPNSLLDFPQAAATANANNSTSNAAAALRRLQSQAQSQAQSGTTGASGTQSQSQSQSQTTGNLVQSDTQSQMSSLNQQTSMTIDNSTNTQACNPSIYEASLQVQAVQMNTNSSSTIINNNPASNGGYSNGNNNTNNGNNSMNYLKMIGVLAWLLLLV